MIPVKQVRLAVVIAFPAELAFLVADFTDLPFRTNDELVLGLRCEAKGEVVVSNMDWWDTSSCTDMSYLFFGHRGRIGKISNWDVSSVRNMTRMFWGCFTVLEDSLEEWKVDSLVNAKDMFYQSKEIKEIPSWVTPSMGYSPPIPGYLNLLEDSSSLT